MIYSGCLSSFSVCVGWKSLRKKPSLAQLLKKGTFRVSLSLPLPALYLSLSTYLFSPSVSLSPFSPVRLSLPPISLSLSLSIFIYSTARLRIAIFSCSRSLSDLSNVATSNSRTRQINCSCQPRAFLLMPCLLLLEFLDSVLREKGRAPPSPLP